MSTGLCNRPLCTDDTTMRHTNHAPRSNRSIFCIPRKKVAWTSCFLRPFAMWIIKDGPALCAAHLAGFPPVIIADVINEPTMGALLKISVSRLFRFGRRVWHCNLLSCSTGEPSRSASRAAAPTSRQYPCPGLIANRTSRRGRASARGY